LCVDVKGIGSEGMERGRGQIEKADKKCRGESRKKWTERERERERERQRERQRDRETERETERERQRDRETETDRDRQRQTETDRQTRQTDRQTDRDRERCLSCFVMLLRIFNSMADNRPGEDIGTHMQEFLKHQAGLLPEGFLDKEQLSTSPFSVHYAEPSQCAQQVRFEPFSYDVAAERF